VGTGWVLEMAMKDAAAAAKRLKDLRQMQGEAGVHILRLKRRILVRALSVISHSRDSCCGALISKARPRRLTPACKSNPSSGGPKRLHSSIEDIYYTTLSLPIYSF